MISNTSYIATATGDGVTLTFSFPYEILANTDLQVSLINTTVTPNISYSKVLGTDYTVSFTAGQEGGSITFTTAPTVNWEIQIIRIRPFTQTVNLVNEGALPAQQVNNQLDSVTMLCIQMMGYINNLITAFAGIAPTYSVPGLVPAVPTIVSATTITIAGLYGTVILSGTTNVTTINGGFTGQRMIFICTGGLTLGTGGNISTSKAVAANVAAELVFDGTNWHHIT